MVYDCASDDFDPVVGKHLDSSKVLDVSLSLHADVKDIRSSCVGLMVLQDGPTISILPPVGLEKIMHNQKSSELFCSHLKGKNYSPHLHSMDCVGIA